MDMGLFNIYVGRICLVLDIIPIVFLIFRCCLLYMGIYEFIAWPDTDAIGLILRNCYIYRKCFWRDNEIEIRGNVNRDALLRSLPPS